MKNLSNLTYTYAGRKYTFTAFIYVNNANNEKDGNYLNNDNVVLFQYENTLNLLFLKGELTYVDKYGIIDRFLDEQFAYCQILNIMHETEIDGDLECEKLSESVKFLHNFFITGILIVNRKGAEITYRIMLYSQNWLNCISNVSYSNYDKAPEDLFDIIKSILGQNELVVHKESFNAIHSGVTISYITNDNDDVISSISYLLHKLYYYQAKDLSLKFLCYNETMERYLIFDVVNTTYVNGTSTIVLSMFKSLMESLCLKYPILLATITKFPRSLTFLNMFNRVLYDYDYKYNVFVDCSIPSASINDYKNEKPETTEELYEKKFKPYNSTLQYKQSGTYWNNDLDIYGEIYKILNDDSALVTTVDADLLRKPGSYVTVNVDRDDITITGDEDIKKLQDTKNKYKALEGIWFVGKVRHLISPSLAKYLQNLIMFRNFVKKFN